MEPDALAGGPSILRYIHETAREYGVEQLVRFGHRVRRAEWSGAQARWTVEVQRGEDGETFQLTCDFLYCCTGYYRYDEGYSPSFAGSERFAGQLVHPQQWPADLDCTGKRVVVIGSGATAVTLVPALAHSAAHVTMVQRSPTYIVAVPARDAIAERLRRRLPAPLAYAAVRWKNVLLMMLNYQLCQRAPGLMRRLFVGLARKRLPAGFDVERHFTPKYDPWDQRVCAAADGDLFAALASGRASMQTGAIETFTESGIRMSSGEELPADVVITATGLNMLVLGGIELALDGVTVDVGASVTYKGMMLCGVPNLALALGYTNASWTLKADLIADYVCRLLSYMDEHGLAACTPQPPDPSLPTEPIMGLTSGYVLRALDQLPRQGAEAPWRAHQNYIRDMRLFRRGRIDDAMEFAARELTPEPELTPAAAGVTV